MPTPKSVLVLVLSQNHVEATKCMPICTILQQETALKESTQAFCEASLHLRLAKNPSFASHGNM